ncbi:zf-HC2 domain-containing protein [Vitiosangium sp. GDMCC 1.1324]|uniref:zf-HC2 domain-containing protein n=1 Tax=Vitiosangium sp. (strain GDMCC 1.1324) TaxID=2138576 RepID=UPI000D344B01|nr:zf-HC2 domain-containing protein [Vitiosangium sp. GDMCC 1.1324]PTL82559.1 ACP synthase [Vitiosangium sp. GDMCC 1.1324]
MSAHLSEWTLRRLHAGELPGAESQQARAHVAACAECHGVLKGLESDQARFEAEVPFDRFAAGVERALKNPSEENSSPRFHGFMVAVAATVLLALLVRPMLSEPPTNRLKGGASAELRIGGEGPQRAVMPGDTESLLQGERVRVGYVPGTYRYVMTVSVDEAGEVSPLYSQAGMSLPVEEGATVRHWLPESVVFTGSGYERVVVVLSERPLEVETVREAARRAWESAGGNVSAMSSLGVDGEESHWLLRKP